VISAGAPRRLRGAFTLLEICIALAILAISMAVLVDSEAGAVVLTAEAERTLVANALAEEVMAEVLLGLEADGFTEQDQANEGDFGDFGADGRFGQTVDFEGEYEDYRYAWTIRRVDLQIGDASGAITELAGMGGTGDAETSGGMDGSILGAFLSGDMLNEMLSPWMREVRVMVWWGDDPGDEEGQSCENCVELVTHVFNPSGQVVDSSGSSSSDEEGSGSSGGSASGGSNSSSGGGKGGSKGGGRGTMSSGGSGR
jgi:type II secretory pathway pseudopilin PulG